MPARPFDPHWISNHAPLSAYLDNLCDKLSAAEERAKRRSRSSKTNFVSAIRAIVLDLYRAHESDPSLEVGIATGQSRLQNLSTSRYGSPLFAPRTFRAAMKILIDQNCIVQTTPHWDDPSGKNSRTARYKATPFLVSALRNAGASAVTLKRQEGAEGIILKDQNKQRLGYENVQFANHARDRLKIINGMLESHWADLALTDDQLANELSRIGNTSEDEAAQSFDFSARTVYRVFNNNDWGQGGRFYGAWWMSCPSKLRRHILIDCKRTVEVDYSGLHPAMLFAEKGLPIPDDPYERCLSTETKDERNLVKRTFNALLNADGINRLNEIEGYSQNVTGKNWKNFKQFIVDSYPEFSDEFGTGVGLRLQYRDSQLAEEVMLSFASSGYGCLSVHDSMIVHHALVDDLVDAMGLAFRDTFGVEAKVSKAIGKEEPIGTSSGYISEDIGVLLKAQHGYEKRWYEFNSSKGQP